jgi:MinD superfamily P-loop ATPase
VAVASGKGGTGKTLIATSLAWHLGRLGRLDHQVTYVDADVAEPNGHLFLRPTDLEQQRLAVMVPALRDGDCAGHGTCERACRFEAITTGAQLRPERCCGCGACLLACPDGALVASERTVGTHRQGLAGPVRFHDAALDVGEAAAPPLIRGLLAELEADAGVQILDAPPGTASNAMWAVRRADHVVLVTEPTPFGLHDLDLAVQMCEGLGRSSIAVVLNRADLGGAAARKKVTDFLDLHGLPLAAEIPFSVEVARAHARCELAAEALPVVGHAVAALAEHLLQIMGSKR